MPIDGTVILKEENKTLCMISNLSDELKNILRDELAFVFHGENAVLNLPEHFTYKNTLKIFLERYDKKPEKTKKGMIGELLSHILIPRFFEDFKSLSVLKNKEESSIKKGFDIIYTNVTEKSLWYSEVKSGHKNKADTCGTANTTLLKRSYKGLKEMLNSSRETLWDSAMGDVLYTLGQIEGASLRTLLSEHSPVQSSPTTSKDKNAVIISVLYEDTKAPLTIKDFDDFMEDIKDKEDFQNILIISFQKSTFEAVADFLKKESENE